MEFPAAAFPYQHFSPRRKWWWDHLSITGLWPRTNRLDYAYVGWWWFGVVVELLLFFGGDGVLWQRDSTLRLLLWWKDA